MNLVLLFTDDFLSETRVRLSGARARHIRTVHRAVAGDKLVVGRVDGPIGRGEITSISGDCVEMDVALDREPPPPLDLALVLALPRPKVLNRVIAGATSMGIKRIELVNSWRVEKSYWKSPRIGEANLRAQCIAGLEQAKDTAMPSIRLHRFFRRFVEDELPAIAAASRGLVAHPTANSPCPRDVTGPVTLAVGPEGGFIADEIASFERAGFQPVALGPRVLRVETAVTALVTALKS